MKKVFYLAGAIVAASAFFMQNDGDLSLELAKAENHDYGYEVRVSGHCGNNDYEACNNKDTNRSTRPGPWIQDINVPNFPR